jgi:hypothetical protein
MHPSVVTEAHQYDENIDLPMWFSSLSLDEEQVNFHE